VPAVASSSQMHRAQTKQPLPSFSSHRASVTERDSYPAERSVAIPHHLRSLIRATYFARASAPQSTDTSCCSARYRLPLIHPRNRRCVPQPRRTIALRTAGLRPVPLHLTLQPRQGGDSSLPQKRSEPHSTACAASLAQLALRAQARLSTQPIRATVQLVTDCADSPAQHRIARRSRGAQSHFVPLASGGAAAFDLAYVREGIHPFRKNDPNRIRPLAQPHSRNMLCARKRAFQTDRRELLFSSLPIACPED
jgi:hypothetical protein